MPRADVEVKRKSGLWFSLGRFNEQGKCQAAGVRLRCRTSLAAHWGLSPYCGVARVPRCGEGTWWRNGLRLLFSRPGPRRLHPQTRPEVRLAAAFPWERESAFWRFVRGRPGTGVDLWVMITALVPEPESPNWARLLVLMSE